MPIIESMDPFVAEILRRITVVLDTLPCGALLVRRGGVMVHVNPRLAEMIGRTREDLLAQPDVAGYCADGACRDKLARAIREFDEPSQFELGLIRADGRRLTVITAGRPLAGDAPLSDYRVVTLIDISQQKAAEESLQAQYREVAKLSDTVLEQALALKDYSKNLEAKVRERTRELHEANLDSIYMLAVASEAKDADTGAHVMRIERYARELARAAGHRDDEAERIGYSAILHDVGKMRVPDAILKKPGPLTADERREMEQHTIAGENILSTKPFFAIARQIARSHHENWDGSGYPDGLRGDSIALPARIVHIVDVYDAVRMERVYKPPWSLERARRFLLDRAGTFFDPDLARTFVALLDGPLSDAP